MEVFVNEPLLDWIKPASDRQKFTPELGASSASSASGGGDSLSLGGDKWMDASGSSSGSLSATQERDASTAWYPRRRLNTTRCKLGSDKN